MKLPEANEADKKTGYEINYDFLAMVVQKLDCEDGGISGSFLTEEDVEAVLLAAQQVMKEQEKNIVAVVKEIENMTVEEFSQFIEKHKDGDIAKAMLETGAIETNGNTE